MKFKNIRNSKGKKKEDEESKLERVLKLIYMLLKNDFNTLDYYGAELGKKKSTVKSYIAGINKSYDNIKKEGFKIKYNRSKEYYTLNTGIYSFIPIFKNQTEELLQAISYISHSTGTPFIALNPLKKGLIKALEQDLKGTTKFSAPEVDSKLKKWLHIINNAIEHKKELRIEYDGKYFFREKFVPYYFILHDFEWYLRVFSTTKKIFETFEINKINKIENVYHGSYGSVEDLPEITPELSNEHIWDWPDDTGYMGKEPVRVELKLTGEAADNHRKKFKYRKEHPSQKVFDAREMADKTRLIDRQIRALEIDINDLREIIDYREQEKSEDMNSAKESLKNMELRKKELTEEKESIQREYGKRFLEREMYYNRDELFVSYEVKNPFKMLPWILSFGGDAEIIEPEFLREKLKREFLKLRERY